MERLGPYRVIGVLGRGASAVVYEAVEEPLGRTVALKVLETAAGEEACARFRREAEVAARLAHPGVVPVYAAGEDQGRPWFAMERVRGQSLEALARRERVGPARAALLVAQVARALAHAHERGVLHRDVKPTNVLVDAEDRARLTDFGAARDLARASLGGGAAPGTPAYGAPEALLGGAATAAADVYGAGALLYRLLTGRDPYEGDVPSVLRRVAAGELVPPRRLLPRIPRDLETVTLRAMAHEAHRRYPSAAALALDLERHAAGEPVLGRPPGPVERARALARRRPRAVAATAALAAVALLPAALLVHRRAAVGAALTRAEGHLGRGEAGLALAAIREAQSLAPRDARSRALLREARVLDLLDRAADASGQGRTEEAVALLEAAVPMAQDLGPRVRDALSTARGDAPLALGGPPGSRVRLRPAGEPRLPPSHALPCTVPLAPGAWEL
ncbi:MAG: serine/threonine protein kinase, partial [Planctomycetes bacterium]|nr:serine/threonine protein kinase [Planctomycetota bacterium]